MRSNWNAELEKRLHRADPSVREMIEFAVVTADDVRKRQDQWSLADSTTGLGLLGNGGVRLAGSLGTKLEHTVSDAWITDLGGGPADSSQSPFLVAMVEWGGLDDPDIALQRVTAYLHPKRTAAAKEVASWKAQLFRLHEVQDLGLPGEELVLRQISAAIEVSEAGTTASDVVFSFTGQFTQPKPKKQGPPIDGGSTYPNPVTLLVIWALKDDGTPAGNVGWGEDTATASKTSSGNTLTQKQLILLESGGYQIATVNRTPRCAFDTSTFSAATISFTGAGNRFDLGAAPVGDVVLVGRGAVPPGASITYAITDNLTADKGDPLGTNGWTAFVDGDHVGIDNTATGGTDLSGVTKQQEYLLRALLTPNAAADVGPILTDLGVEDIKAFNLDGLATVTGDPQWAVAVRPNSFRGEITRATIKVLRTGNQDYRDPIGDILTGNNLKALSFRVWIGAPDLDRSQWMLHEAYDIQNYVPKPGAYDFHCYTALHELKVALPREEDIGGGVIQRVPLKYESKSAKFIYDDFLDNQFRVPDRKKGPGVTDDTTLLDNVIAERTDGKAELDAAVYPAGGGLFASQGRIKFANLFTEDAPVAVFDNEEIQEVSVSPGLDERAPEFFIPFNYNRSTKEWGGEIRRFHNDALTKLGTTGLSAENQLDERVARWVPTKALASLLATRVVDNMGTGLRLWAIRALHGHPHLEPGDPIVVKTDLFVGRDPNTDAAIRGRKWVTGVVVATGGTMGHGIMFWVRQLDDIKSAEEDVTREQDVVEEVNLVGTAGVTVNNHFAFGKASAPAPSNPWYVLRTDASAVPRAQLIGDDGTTEVMFWEARYDTGLLQVGDQLTKQGAAPPDANVGRFQSLYQTSDAAAPHIGALYYAEQSAATVHNIKALEGYTVASHATGTVDLAVGVAGHAELTGPSTLTWARGVAGGIAVNDASGTVTAGAALHAEAPIITAGTLTTAYGLYVESITGAASNYAIFTNSGLVSLGSNVGILHSNAPVRLQIGDEVKLGTAPVDASVGNVQSEYVTADASAFHVSGLFYARQSAATVHSIQGVEGFAVASHGSGTVALAIGVPGNAQLAGAGDLTWARGVAGGVSMDGAAGDIVQGAALFAQSPAKGVGGGAINTAYGLYVDDQDDGDTNWAIYTNNGKVRFGGDLWMQEASGSEIAMTTGSAAGHVVTGDGDWAVGGNSIMGMRAKWNGTLIASMAMVTGDDTVNKDNGEIIFFTSTSGGSLIERLRILNSYEMRMFTATADGHVLTGDGNHSAAGNNLMGMRALWDGNLTASISLVSGDDTVNKDNGEILFFTSASGGALIERMRITSAGAITFKQRVDQYDGTGVTLAAQYGSNDDIGLTGGGGANDWALLSQDAITFATNADVSEVYQFTVDHEFRMVNTGTSGNVITGESNPSVAGTNMAGLRAKWNGTLAASIALITGDDTVNKDNGEIAFYTSAASGTLIERLRILNSYELLMSSTGAFGHVLTGDSNHTSADNGIMGIRAKWNGTLVGSVVIVSGDDTVNKDNGEILFYTSAASGSLVERMRIDDVGFVGIGTPAPEAMLNVFAASAGTIAPHAGADEVVIEGTDGNGVGLTILSPDGISSRIAFGSPTGGNLAATLLYRQNVNLLAITASQNSASKITLNTGSAAAVEVSNDLSVASGKITVSEGIVFTGALSTGTGIASSGASGNLRFYANGVQYVTLTTAGLVKFNQGVSNVETQIEDSAIQWTRSSDGAVVNSISSDPAAWTVTHSYRKDAIFSINSSEVVRFQEAGMVRIGGAALDQDFGERLRVRASAPDASGTVQAARIEHHHTAATTGQVYGLASRTYSDNTTGTLFAAIGISGEATQDASGGTSTWLRGVSGTAGIVGSGTATNAVSIYGNAPFKGTGTLANAYTAYLAAPASQGGTKNITLWLNDSSGTGSNTIEAASGAKLTTAGVWTDAPSWRRFKRDITSLTEHPGLVTALRRLDPVSYIDRRTDLRAVGFIVDAYQTVLEQGRLVQYAAPGLAPMHVASLAVAGWQIHDRRLDQLTARVDALERAVTTNGKAHSHG